MLPRFLNFVRVVFQLTMRSLFFVLSWLLRIGGFFPRHRRYRHPP